MIKNYVHFTYFILALILVPSHIHTSSLSSLKNLSAKIQNAGYDDFMVVTGLMSKLQPNDSDDAIRAKLRFAQDFYATHRANQRIAPEASQYIEKRTQKIAKIISEN